MNKNFLIITIFLLISVSLVVADEDCTGGVPSVYYLEVKKTLGGKTK